MLRPAVAANQQRLLIAAVRVHDIGYAPTVRDTGFHPLGGANYLSGQGYPPVLAELVAHHFGAWFVADVRGLSDELRRYRFG